MKILYGTTNKGKLQAMINSVKGLNIELVSLNDMEGKLPEINESGTTPLENAEIKARAYYEAFHMPVFSCDSGLYFDELSEEEQPGIHVRRVNGKELTDAEMTEYYASLAKKHGGRITGRYRNAIYFILDENHHYSSMDMSIATEPFILVDKPHPKRVEGFPLDPLSIDIATGKYYHDLETKDVSTSVDDGVRKFFAEVRTRCNEERRTDMNFENKVVVITGGAHGIGQCTANEFKKCGAHVCVIDCAEGDHYVGDIGNKETLEAFAQSVIEQYGRVDVLVNNAKPKMHGIDNCTWEQFQNALNVGVTAPFYLSKLFAPYFSQGASIINISSSRDRMSQPQSESYTAAKGGIVALTHALAVSFAGKVRVNSISPGWIDTDCTVYEGPDATQHLAGRVGNPLDIANMILFLASEKAGFITGENICIDGGQTKLMIYHGDHGWELHES